VAKFIRRSNMQNTVEDFWQFVPGFSLLSISFRLSSKKVAFLIMERQTG